MVSALHLNHFSPNYLSFFEAPVDIKNLAIMTRVCIKISEVLTLSLPKLLNLVCSNLGSLNYSKSPTQNTHLNYFHLHRYNLSYLKNYYTKIYQRKLINISISLLFQTNSYPYLIIYLNKPMIYKLKNTFIKRLLTEYFFKKI